MPKPIRIWIDDDEVDLPSKYEVCYRCRGEGHHGHPAFDGVSVSWWYEDDPSGESLDNYMSGKYDVRCEECNGQRVVLVPDESRMTQEQIQGWDDHCQQEWEYQQEREMERRMGA